jgi:hypothetical protein
MASVFLKCIEKFRKCYKMKQNKIFVAITTLYVVSSALPQSNPPSGGGGFGGFGSLSAMMGMLQTPQPIKFDKSIDLKAEFCPDAQRTQYRYGPLRFVGKDVSLSRFIFVTNIS